MPETNQPAHRRWLNPPILVLGGAVLALLFGNVYFMARLDGVEEDMRKLAEDSRVEMARLRQVAELGQVSSRQMVEELEREVAATRQEAASAVGKARAAATKRAEELARELARAQSEQHQKISGVLAQVEQKTGDQLRGVSSDLTTVRGDVTETKTELDATVAELKRMRGDLGFMSGMIATNAKELSALKKLGDREYAEFTLPKSGNYLKVGNVMLKLRKTDAKHHKYSVELLADDRKVEKKDRYVNEPVQFYLARSAQPFELVINEVHKDKVIGYLAMPKAELARK
jgi:F0F1-type ATP synthase membrane subunit b/b'